MDETPGCRYLVDTFLIVKRSLDDREGREKISIFFIKKVCALMFFACHLFQFTRFLLFIESSSEKLFFFIPLVASRITKKITLSLLVELFIFFLVPVRFFSFIECQTRQTTSRKVIKNNISVSTNLIQSSFVDSFARSCFYPSLILSLVRFFLLPI